MNGKISGIIDTHQVKCQIQINVYRITWFHLSSNIKHVWQTNKLFVACIWKRHQVVSPPPPPPPPSCMTNSSHAGYWCTDILIENIMICWIAMFWSNMVNCFVTYLGGSFDWIHAAMCLHLSVIQCAYDSVYSCIYHMFCIFIFCCTTSYSTYVHLFVINLLRSTICSRCSAVRESTILILHSTINLDWMQFRFWYITTLQYQLAPGDTSERSNHNTM